MVDGRSGAGKSTLARDLVAAWPFDDAPDLLALDDVYPGWDGLAAGAAYVVARVLVPRAAGRGGSVQRWDWAADRYDETRELDAGRALVVEGSGALTPASAALSDVRVWLDAPAELRRERALARDGDSYRPHWDRWADQEDQHLRRHDPHALATHVFTTG